MGRRRRLLRQCVSPACFENEPRTLKPVPGQRNVGRDQLQLGCASAFPRQGRALVGRNALLCRRAFLGLHLGLCDPQLEPRAALRGPVLRIGWVRPCSVRSDLQRLDDEEPGWDVCVFGVHDGCRDVDPVHGAFARVGGRNQLISFPGWLNASVPVLQAPARPLQWNSL